jgi:hypothetical protein
MKRVLLGILIGWVSFAVGLYYLFDLGVNWVTKDNPIILIKMQSSQLPDWETFDIAPEDTLAYTGEKEKLKVLNKTFECKTAKDDRQPSLTWIDLDRCDKIAP